MNGFTGTVGLNAGKSLGRGGSAQLVSVVKLPQNLAFNQKALRLSGEITQANPANNTVRIETKEGSIEAKVSPKIVRTVNTGQAVVVEIPKGNSPKQIRLSLDVSGGRPPGDPSPAVKTPAVTYQSPNIKAQGPQPPAPTGPQASIRSDNISINTPAPPPPQTQREQTDRIQLPLQNQNVTSNNSGTNSSQNAQTEVITAKALQQFLTQTAKLTTGQPQALNTDANVRLLAVPPVQAQEIATQFLRSLPLPTVVQPSANIQNPATLILQNALPQPNALNTSGLLNTPSQPLVNTANLTAPPPTTSVTNAQTASLPSAITSSTAVLTTTQTLTQNQSFPLLQTIQGGNAGAAQSTGAIIPPQTSGQAATLQPIAFDPSVIAPQNTAQGSTILNAPKIDINILRLTPPTPLINAATPNAGAAQPAIQSIPAATNFPPQILTTPQAGALTGKVTGFTPQGLPLITARFPGAALPQSFILQFKTNNVQLGSNIEFIAKQPAQLTATTAQAVTNPLLRGFQWPAVDQLMQTLQQLNPQMAASLTRTLPNAGNPAQLGTAAMMIIAAIRSGDFSGVLGERKMDALQRAGRDNILNQLTQSRAPAAATAAPEAASGGDWRAVPLPMFWEGEIQRVTLYTRKEGDDSNHNQDNKKIGQTRFVFDLSLTRMGDVQLDGFLKDTRLDLIVRTQNAFSLPMQQTMRQAYSGALGHTDLTGELNFQGSTAHWVNVLEEKEQLGVDV